MLLLLLALPGVALAQGTGTIAGRVLEADGVTAIIGANVRVGGTTLGAATDLDGNYRIIGVPVGAYDVTASYAGYPSSTVTGTEINAGSTRQLNFTLTESTTDVVDIVYEAPLITNDAVGQSRVVTGQDLENLPIRGVAATVALQGGVVNTEGSSDLNIRGGRAEEVQYFVDGVRVSTTNGLLGVNQQAIEQQEVLIGTIPARYGDVQSGVISITTKTGADRFFGSAEGVTSTGLDSYGYNLGSLSLGGPVVPGRVGFFLSGELNHNDDNNPYGTATYRLKDDIYTDLQLRPQVIQVRDNANGGRLSYIPLPAELITGTGFTRDSLQTILRRNGTLSATQSLAPGAGLIDRAETLTAESFDLVKGKSDPLDAVTLNGSLNFTFGDIGLRLGGGYATQDRSVYSFTGSLYNRDAFYNTERDNYRVYGTLRQRLTNSAFYQLQGEFQDFRFVQYQNGYSSNIEDVLLYGDSQAPQNAVASRYYTILGSANGGRFASQFGRDSGPRPAQLPGGTFSSAGRTNFNNYQKSHDQRYRFSGSATAQVGVNQIEFGGEYQQDTRRFFSIAGFNLASFVDDSAVDPAGGQAVGATYPTGITTYDQFDFNTLRRLTTRYGYDYLGLNEVNDQSIDGYFADASGNRANTNLAPYSPVYYAGYIQDKIEFQDLVVQLGLRVDAFDNNTDVLLDLYAPTPIFRANTLDSRPAGIDDNYAVYYNASNAVVGFRDLDGNFYDVQGTRTSTDAIIRDARGQVRSDAAAPRSAAFVPYETQITVMPRVGVSFPVTDRALFFASYNVTSQRPTENAFAALSSYEELDGQSRINNPALQPERTTQYELGFRQRLGERAAVSLSGFYRTQENKISVRNAAGGFPQYSTYFNADFTTTQGAEVNFDLRRTNNLQLSANYTLSFAQGTGSDANATATAAWRGDFFPQFISPSDFDQRHTGNVTLDYRLAEGDGPLLGGIRPFENFGINLIGQFGSGQRYTRLEQNSITFVSDSFTPNVSGTLNGSTLPATTRFDIRVDRAFDLGFSNARMRAYVQVQNLLDTRNRLAVYRATGQANEDGFASSPGGAQLLTTPGRLFNYDAYTSGPLNVGGSQSSGAGSFYSAPRQVRLGFLFDF